MKLSQESKKSIEADIEHEVEQQMEDYPIKILLDGKEIYYDHRYHEGGEIAIKIWSPIAKIEEK